MPGMVQISENGRANTLLDKALYYATEASGPLALLAFGASTSLAFSQLAPEAFVGSFLGAVSWRFNELHRKGDVVSLKDQLEQWKERKDLEPEVFYELIKQIKEEKDQEQKKVLLIQLKKGVRAKLQADGEPNDLKDVDMYIGGLENINDTMKNLQKTIDTNTGIAGAWRVARELSESAVAGIVTIALARIIVSYVGQALHTEPIPAWTDTEAIAWITRACMIIPAWLLYVKKGIDTRFSYSMLVGLQQELKDNGVIKVKN